ncbi:MAG: SurA N-terminal domain-containing protein [Verrucomicrobia bacterium]|nr:SurA N-terminal domain-containing protein [Verrucomicrobiota bacterium]
MNSSAFSAAGVCLHTIFSSSRLTSLSAAGLIGVLSWANPLHAAVELNSIAATVNGKGITTKEVSFHMAPIMSVLHAKFPRQGPAYEKELGKARTAILDRLIENKIVLSELERRGAAIPDHVIDSEVKRIISEVFNGSETEFRKSLKESGMNMQGFRESQQEKILIQAFRAQQFNDVPPATSSEVSAHYQKRRSDLRDRSKDKVTYRKIFIRATDPENPGSTPESQLAIAEGLAAQLRDGADFAELAIAHSEGAFASEGGLWEDEDRVNLSPAFAEVIFESETDTIIGPLKDPAGFIIIKVIETKPGPAPSLKEVSDRMRQEVEIEKRAARYNKWLEVVKRGAMIERRI